METVKNTDAEKMEEKASLELAAEKLANVSGGTRNEAEEADKKKSACPNWIRKKPTIKGSPDWLLDRHKFRKIKLQSRSLSGLYRHKVEGNQRSDDSCQRSVHEPAEEAPASFALLFQLVP